MLKPYDAHLAYGYIPVKRVEELIQRRAYTKVGGGGRKTLSDNLTIEKVVGDKGILCVSDLVHEIYSIGPNFQNALKVLLPFHLSAPVGNFEKNVLHVHDDVESKGGFIGKEMDTFLQKIL